MSLKINQALRNVCYKRKHFLGLISSASRNYGDEVKPFKDIPKAPRVPILGSIPYFMMAGGHSQMHEYADKLHKNLGPIFFDKLGKHKLIFIADPEANRKMYYVEGIYPKHTVLDSWEKVLKEISKGRGLFFMDDEEWHETRSFFNPIMLRKNSLKNHVTNVSAVCKDLMDIWKLNPPSSNLRNHLASWSIECFGEIVFGKRLGFMEKLKSNKRSFKHKREDELVNATYQVFTESANLHTWPIKTVNFLRPFTWRRFRSAMSTVLEIGGEYVQDAVKECRAENPSEKIRECLVYKALMDKVNEETFTEVMVDIFLASPDTTTHASSWALYLLGRHPEIQAKAREEIFNILGQQETDTISLETISNIKHIDAIIRETLRLYSIATFITRTLPNETELCNYVIPAGSKVITSLITMGRDPNNYTEPDQFRPERWILNRKNPEQEGVITHKYVRHDGRAYTPFAVGRRSCIGRRVAELNLSLLLIEALRKYEWTVEEEIPMKMRLVSVPSKDVILKLKSL